MSFRRKPPEGNVRRVAAIGNNSRHTVAGKGGETVQVESWGERGFLFGLQRNPQVIKYRSQPMRLSWTDAAGKAHTYVPDYMVWKSDGTIEVHEITRSERRAEDGNTPREREATKICEAHGWQYIVHDERTLPDKTEVANLLWLYAFRPKVYFYPSVAEKVTQQLKGGKRVLLRVLIHDLAELFQQPNYKISGALCHLLWHGVLAADFKQLMFLDGLPMPRTLVWLAEEQK